MTLPFWVAARVWSWIGPRSKMALTPKLFAGTAAVMNREVGGVKVTVPTSTRRTISSSRPS